MLAKKEDVTRRHYFLIYFAYSLILYNEVQPVIMDINLGDLFIDSLNGLCLGLFISKKHFLQFINKFYRVRPIIH